MQCNAAWLTALVIVVVELLLLAQGGVTAANSIVKCWASSWSLVMGCDPGTGEFCDVRDFNKWSYFRVAGVGTQTSQCLSNNFLCLWNAKYLAGGLYWLYRD